MKRIKRGAEEILYVPLSEVARVLNVKTHVLYYWEKKFPELKPYKISQRKFYKKDQIELLKRIKELTEEGYTLEAVKKLLLSPKKKVKLKKEEPSSKEVKQVVREVLEELKRIYESL